MKKKPPPKKRVFKAARYVKVTGPIHVKYTLDGLNRIAHELERKARMGRNFEDREEWRNTWDELFHKRRGF